MAGKARNWTKTLAVAVLLMGAGTAGFAQSPRTRSVEDGPTGSLSGKLTDLHSRPLEGVSVVARNQATGAETRTITTKNGIYRFSGLAPGEYSVTADSPQLGRGQVEWIVVDGGHEARVQTAMELTPQPPSSLLAASPVPEQLKVEEPPKLNRPVLELETLTVSDAALTAEPMRLLPLRGHGVKAEIPQTTAFELNAALEIEPQRTLPLAGRSLPASAPPETVASAPVAAASASVPPGANAAGQAASGAALPPPPRPAEPATAIALSAPTAVQPAQAPSKPAAAAAQASGPAAAVLSSKMSAADLQALPVSGRHWQDFVLDNTPTSTTPAGGQGEIMLHGAGQPAGNAVDGVSRGLAFGPTNESGQGSQGRGPLGQGENPAGMAQVGAGGHGLAVSEAAIRAVETAAGNVEAAADRAAGGRMNIETERGANELHGQGFFFDRQNTWGARNPFTQWVTETKQAVLTYNPSGPPLSVPVFTPEPYTPPDHEMTWGIGVGSRILRNKLFWFAALDGYQRNDPGLATVKHPYLCAAYNSEGQCTENTGFFATPSNCELNALSARLGSAALGSDCVSGLIQGLTAYSGMLETLTGLLGPAPRTATQWTGFGRLDWQADERDRFTLEGIGARWNSPGGGLTRVSEAYGNHSFGSSKASEVWLLGRWEAFLTPNLLTVTQASAGRIILEARPEAPSTLDNFEQSLLSGNMWGQLPQIVVDNRYGFTIGNPSRFGQGSYPDEHLYHGQESVDWIRGKLLVRAGFEVSHNSDATSLLRNQTGTYTYSNVENFISDALVFENPILRSDPLDPYHQHNCDETGKVWVDSGGTVRGVGNLPCYSYYSQTMGPSSWHLSTNDWAGYATAQWEANKRVVFSAGLRWEREQLPPPIAALQNTNLPLTGKLPNLGNQWGPRVSLAVGSGEKHWPVLRLGYGMYFGRTGNLALETALTQTGSYNAQTGSYNGDVTFFMRPTDDLPNNGGGAPPFPYVLQGEPGSAVKPGAVEFASNFHNPEVHQAVAAVEETLPSHVEVTASAMMSLGRRLPISIDTNLDSPTSTQTITYAVVDPIRAADPTKGGPIKATEITVPFYASWPAGAGTCPDYLPQPTSTVLPGRPCPDYQQITNIESRANSTYEAAMLKVVRYGRRGLSLHAHYTYAHAMDWNPNESAQVAGNDILDPSDFGLEYGVSNLDVRHSAGAMVVYEAPWKLRGRAGKLGNGWMVSGVGQFRSGLPYTMHTSGSLAKEFLLTTNGIETIVGLGPGMNGSGGDNRVYGKGSDGTPYNIGRNTYRYPATWKIDLRLGRRFDLGHMRQLELLAESFNLFNHQNVTEVETTGYYIESGTPSSPPSLNFLTGPYAGTNGTIVNPNTTAFGQPLNINATNFYRERQIQIGLRLRF
ncbi:MAG: TonB-dependent receptor [Terracidiphilus sp.]|jgi:hypothetical protein